MKTILIAEKNLKDRRSGVPRIVYQQIQYFCKLGYKVYVIAERINKNDVKKSGGIPIKTFRWPISGYFRRLIYNWQVNLLVHRIHPDLIIGHGDIFCQDILYIHNCVHLAHERIYGEPLSQKKSIGRIHSKILSSQNFKMLVCNSQLMRQEFFTRFGIEKAQMKVIYPKFDPNKFNIDDRQRLRPVVRQQYNIDDDTVFIGLITSGNFKKRNVSLFIDIINALYKNKRRTKIKALVAGKNNDPSYAKRVSELGLDNIVKFAPSINDVEKYYFAIDIFVLPAHIEEFGLSVLEAMICGNPVIVSDRVGASEVMKDKSRDYIVSQVNTNAYVDKIVSLIDSVELRNELGLHNHKTAQKFSAINKNEAFAQLLDKMT